MEKFGYSGPARDWMGRGISMVTPTNYFTYYLWNDADSNDMRNSPVNIQRVFYARLAETYLVRAEAYRKAGNPDLTAADINVVRDRAGATPVTPGEVNIDYILDERIRELFGEELHTLTLCCLGLLYDRTKRFGQIESQQTVMPKNNLMPIPQAVIDANNQANFAQNPGY